MSRQSMIFSWIASVVLAFVVGWYSGIKNAASVAATGANIMMYLFVAALIAVAVGVAYMFMKRPHHDRHLDRYDERMPMH